MNIKKVRAGVLATVIAATGAFGLAACSSDSDDSSSSSESSEESAEGSEDGEEATEIDVAPDLELALTTVQDGLAEDPEQVQIMLASDVEEPTYKYGLLVMPYVKSDASESVTGTVNIDDSGNFTIEAKSAATGDTYQIDQDGNITEVTE